MFIKRFVRRALFFLMALMGIFFTVEYVYSSNDKNSRKPLSVYFASEDVPGVTSRGHGRALETSRHHMPLIQDLQESSFGGANAAEEKSDQNTIKAKPLESVHFESGNLVKAEIEEKKPVPEVKPPTKPEIVEKKPAPELKQPPKKPEVVEKKPAPEVKPPTKPEIVEKKPAPEDKPPTKPEIVEKKPAPEVKKPPTKPEIVEKKPAPEIKQPEVVEKKPTPEVKKPPTKPEIVEKKPAPEVKQPPRPAAVEEKKPGTQDQKINHQPIRKESSGPGTQEKRPVPEIKEASIPKESIPPVKDQSKPAEVKQPRWGEKPFAESRTFQAVDRTSLFIFSAFWDQDNNIRIFGMSERVHYTPKLKCLLWLHNPPSPGEVPTSTEYYIAHLPEHHSKKYVASYLRCKVPPEVAARNPVLVTISVEKDGYHNNVSVPIHQRENWSSEFTMCIAPLFNQYNRVGPILEMIELNRQLGATKFFFYNYSIGPDLNEILNHYKRKGLVEIINWQLPTGAASGLGHSGMDIHYFGQLSAMNDCVYRNRHQSKYVVLTDLDEFVVPNITSNFSTWGELIAHRKKINPKATVFWIRNIFFPRSWAEKDNLVFHKSLPKERFTTLTNRYREDAHNGYGDRSKNIVDPLGVRTVSIHNIAEKGGPRDLVPVEEASMHHYRYRHHSEHVTKIYDDTVWKRYGPAVVENVDKVWNEIQRSKKSR